MAPSPRFSSTNGDFPRKRILIDPADLLYFLSFSLYFFLLFSSYFLSFFLFIRFSLLFESFCSRNCPLDSKTNGYGKLEDVLYVRFAIVEANEESSRLRVSSREGCDLSSMSLVHLLLSLNLLCFSRHWGRFATVTCTHKPRQPCSVTFSALSCCSNRRRAVASVRAALGNNTVLCRSYDPRSHALPSIS